MGSWNLQSIAGDASKLAASNITKWPEHVTLFDDTVDAVDRCRWIHPWENLPARVSREQREAGPRLIVPSYLATSLSSSLYPNDEPGSEQEAQSYCLHLLTMGALRSLVRAGYMALCGLTLEALGAHRRTRETILQIEVLLTTPGIGLDCWRLSRQHSTRLRKRNPFLQAANAATHRISNKQNYDDSDLTPLELRLRQSSDDAGLHLGPHAGIHHGLMGKAEKNQFCLFDRGIRSAGVALWRFASETRQLVSIMAQSATWMDRPRWAAESAPLQERSASLELQDRKERGLMDPSKTPWTDLDTLTD